LAKTDIVWTKISIYQFSYKFKEDFRMVVNHYIYSHMYFSN